MVQSKVSRPPSRLTSVAQLDFEPHGPVRESPRDWRDQVIYQLLIDRFDDNKDAPAYDPKTAPRGHDPRQGGVFQGGTLAGITRRLDYIQELGATAVWISPPFKQRQDDPGSYHGYAIQDFLAIDPRFGTLDDLKYLVAEAHRRGMYIILDIVLNHTGDVWGYEGGGGKPYNPDGPYPFGAWHKISKGAELGPDDAVWPIELQDPDAFKRRGQIRDLATCDRGECIDGDFFSLKDLDTSNPKVLDALIRIYKYWIAATDVDAYRIDTVKHIEPGAMTTFCNAIHEYTHRIGKHNFILFGEVIGDDELLHRYIGQNTPLKGSDEHYPRMNAVLDFPLYSVLEEVLKGQKTCGELRARYEKFGHYFRDFAEAGRYYVTFVDNHDQPSRPWRRFLHGADDPRLATLAIGYLLCNMGIPCIYYGTEQAFNGGDGSDVAIRETMFGGQWGAFDTTGVHFFNPDQPIYQAIAGVARIRHAEPALRYGRQYFRDISGNGKDFGCPTTGQSTLAFSRLLDTDEILITLNLDAKPRADWVLVDAILTPPGSKMIDLLNGGDPHPVKAAGEGLAAVQVKLQGHSMAILKKG
jgi:glycosidase